MNTTEYTKALADLTFYAIPSTAPGLRLATLVLRISAWFNAVYSYRRTSQAR